MRTSVTVKAGRFLELRRILESRRREIKGEVQDKMRFRRAQSVWGGKQNEGLDAIETSGSDIQDEIELTLIEMRGETLNKIDDALLRLDDGGYGNCFECGGEIAEKRLCALPFAVRCKDCEEAREQVEERGRTQASLRGNRSLLSLLIVGE